MPVPNATVDSHPLNVDTALVGIVGAHHRWAEAGSVDVGVFCDEPMLFNPAVSEEWMGPSCSPTSVPGVTHGWSKPLHQIMSMCFSAWSAVTP